MSTPSPLPAQAGCCPHYLCRVSFSPITPPPVEPRDGATLTHIQKAFYTIGCCYQMTWTPHVPGSPLEPWHCLWSCACYQRFDVSSYGCIVAHLSSCFNKALKMRSEFVTVQTTETFLFSLKIWFYHQFYIVMIIHWHNFSGFCHSCIWVPKYINQSFLHVFQFVEISDAVYLLS